MTCKVVVMSAPGPSRALPRMLFLHGWCQNASVFRSRVRAVDRRLSKICECVFMDAPHVIPRREGRKDSALLADRENARGWWIYDEALWVAMQAAPVTSAAAAQPAVETDAAEDAADAADTTGDASDDEAPTEFDFTLPREYHGWAASRAAISRVWAEQGPFDYVLGFSQGAVAVHLLLSELEACQLPDGATRMSAEVMSALQPLLSHPPRACVCVAGFPATCDLSFLPPEYKLRTPSLHVSSPTDIRVPAVLQRSLQQRFEAGAWLDHAKGHAVPQRAAEVAAIASFLRTYAPS